MSNLNIASRALTTNLAALQVIGHNIANVNTEGYSRQTLEQRSVDGQQIGGVYFGRGVEIADVRRIYDELLTRESVLTKSIASSDAARYQRLQQLEGLFPMGDTGLGASLNSALNAWVDVASSPTDLTARTVAIARAEEFSQRLQDVTARIDELRVSSVQQIDATIQSVNNLAKEIAGLNLRIIEGSSAGKQPNDLLDQRDQLVRKMNEYVQTRTVESANGSLTVFVGGSLPLVLGGDAFELARGDQVDPPPSELPLDPNQVSIVLKREGQPYSIADNLLGGGALNGLVRYVNDDIGDTVNQLGRLSLSLAMQVNAQHRLGVDLNGNAGGDFFSIGGGYLSVDGATGAVSISALQSNASGPAMTATVTDPTAFVASNYEVRFDSTTSGQVIRLSDGKVTAFNGVGGGVLQDASGALNVDGLSFSIDVAAATSLQAGDRYLIKPFNDASRNIEVAIAKPESLAAATPLIAEFGTANTGGLGLETLGATAAGPYPTATLTYSAATGRFDVVYPSVPAGLDITHYPSVVPPAPDSYAPGEPIQLVSSVAGEPGWTLTLRGIPADGDTLTIRPPAANETTKLNAGNARAILGLRDVASFEGTSLSDGYVSVFSDVASRVQSGKFAADFSETKAVSAETARANVSGVNLDEEAARLLQYQQSYQAAAKYLQTAQSTFDILINSFGG